MNTNVDLLSVQNVFWQTEASFAFNGKTKNNNWHTIVNQSCLSSEPSHFKT